MYNLTNLNKSWYGVEYANVDKYVHYLITLAKKYFNDNTDLCPKAIFVPHAGLYFSGLAAVSGYASFLNTHLKPKKETKLVIILSTLHQINHGIFTPNTDKIKIYNNNTFRIENNIINNIELDFLKIVSLDVFKNEHSMEIQMPFINYCFPHAYLLPFYIGELENNEATDFANILNILLNKYDNEIAIIANGDFSHFTSKVFPNNFSENLHIYEKSLLNKLLNPDNNMFNYIDNFLFNSIHNLKIQPTICGINVLKVLYSIQNIYQSHVKLLNKYTSGHITYKLIEANIITKNFLNFYKHNGDKIVSYCSFGFYDSIDKVPINRILSRMEELLLIDYAKNCVKYALHNLDYEEPLLLCQSFKKKTGLFVTLRIENNNQINLRGCIGVISKDNSILTNIKKYALYSAFKDSRFNPVNLDEYNKLIWSIDLLDEKKLLDNYKQWKIYDDGIILQKNSNSAIFLPVVPKEHCWDREQTLGKLAEKAGLKYNDWMEAQLWSIPGYEFVQIDFPYKQIYHCKI